MKKRPLTQLLLSASLFIPTSVFVLPLVTFPAVAQQCSGVEGRSTVETRNHDQGEWVQTTETRTVFFNKVETLWLRTETWEEWRVTRDSTGCPYSEHLLRRESRTYEQWRGPVGY